MSLVKQFDKYLCSILPGVSPYSFEDKEKCISQHISYMLNRTQCMFTWNGLPDSIPQRVLELYLQVNGNVCFYEYNDTLYVFTGGLGGEPNPYYMPTIYTVANPALKFSKTLRIDEECIVVPNDSLYMGLMPLCKRYGTMLTEVELSLDIANVNSRIVDLISASDDRTYESALEYLRKVRKGEPGIIAENAFLEGVRVQPYGVSGVHGITDLIELEQYIKASWYNELGLNANYNMKRESLNTSESQMNNDALYPLIDDMLRQRQIGCDKVNSMFGTNISVQLSSSWEDNQLELDAEQEILEIESSPSEQEGGNDIEKTSEVD